jgi:hypothetical protein
MQLCRQTDQLSKQQDQLDLLRGAIQLQQAKKTKK